jgi:CubicO group peptidase (beta-lactamase class C family)
MSKFDPVWRSLDTMVASGWAPGIVAGVRHGGETEFYATGVRTFEAPDAMQTSTPFRLASLSKFVGGALAAALIADGLIGLDDPVERWLPELADPRVLASPDAPLDRTVPADRPITVRHLLTLTHGLGFAFAESPVQAAIQGWGTGPFPPQMSADEFMARIGSLPLAYQPGTRWTYHTGSDILAVLLARAAGSPLRDVLKERITDPLGMHSTGFSANHSTLPTAYRPTPDGLVVFDEYDGAFSHPPQFESLGGGLVSTVTDYLAFLSALADDKLLPGELRAQLTADQLTAEQRAGTTGMMDPTVSWGWQVSVETAVSKPWSAPGRYGWTGGAGTSAYVDPSRDLIGVVLTQRFMSGPNEPFSYFWEPLAAAI